MSFWIRKASVGHTAAQSPHFLQDSFTVSAVSVIEMALTGQTSWHFVQAF
jgi:hypothetical protein